MTSSNRVGGRLRDRMIPALFMIGMVALAVAWAGGNPPTASPDEPENFVKTVATGQLQFTGAPYQADESGLAPRAKAWFDRVGYGYRIPGKLTYDQTINCFAFDATKTADCAGDPRTQHAQGTVTRSTAQGRYEPFLYLPAGLATRGADNFWQAQLRARIANAVIAALLIGWGALLLWRGRRDLWRLAGLAVGVTPAVLFLSGAVTTNGVETAAAVCLWAAVIRLRRLEPEESARSAFVALGVSASVLALTRMIDPLFVVMAIVVLSYLLGSRTTRARWRQGGRAAPIALGVALVAMLVTLVWDFAILPSVPFDSAVARDGLKTAIKQLPNQVRQVVGIFGWNDTTMPQPAYLLWLILAVVLLGLALRYGSNRDRLVLIGLIIAIGVADVAFAVGVQAQIGFGMQVRYFLPLTVAVPMLAADTIAHRFAARRTRWSRLAPVILIGAAALQLIAWTANEHRYAVGAGGSWMLPWSTRWTPVGGWTIWVGLAILGTLALIAPAALAGRTTTARAESDPVPTRGRARSLAGSDPTAIKSPAGPGGDPSPDPVTAEPSTGR